MDLERGHINMKRVMIAAWITEDDKYENYPNAMKKLGAEGFISLNIDDLDDADALILPGSNQDMNPKLWGQENVCCNDINDELDEIQWKLLKKAAAQGKPVLGICRGMQFINVYFGGTLIQDLPSSDQHAGTTPETYHDIFTVQGTFMGDLYPIFTKVNTRHHQGVGSVGEMLLPTAVWTDEDDDMVLEAIQHRELPIYGVQWHPERMSLDENAEVQELGDRLLKWWLSL